MSTIEIDGAFGEGGGQILRSSLSLAAVLGVGFKISNVRLIGKICGGDMSGARQWSGEIEYHPGPATADRYSFQVGTAGSTSLVFQTLLPALASCDGPSTVSVSGGTHNPMAPPFESIAECYLPALETIGLRASVELVRHGFAPKGGGELKATVAPWLDSSPLDLTRPVDWEGPEATIVIANLPDHVAFREQETLAKSLRIDESEIAIEPLAGELGPGNAIFVRYRAGGLTALITSFGQPRKRAEQVAREAARDARNFARSHAPVGPHLADQLLLPLALGPGGAFTTSEITEHTRTQAHVIKAFLGIEIEMKGVKPDQWLVTVPGSATLPAGD